MLHGIFQPDVAVVTKPVSNEETGGPKRAGVDRSKLVRREHLDHHAVVGLVRIHRFDDPIAPAPNVRLALADFGTVPGPIAVTPDVHPMPAPTFPVPGAVQQTLHNFPIARVGRLRREFLQLRGRRRHTDEVQVEPTQQDARRRRIDGNQAALLVSDGQKSIDRITDPSGVHRWHRGLCDRSERPVGQSVHPIGSGHGCAGRHRGQKDAAEDAGEDGKQPSPPAGVKASVVDTCRG